MTTLVDDLVTCAECDTTLSIDDVHHTVNAIAVCDPCARVRYWFCDICRRYSDESTTAADDDNSVCQSCELPHGYYECDDCETLITRGSLCTYHRRRHLTSCSCGECSCDNIHTYDFKPEPDFRGTGPLFLGLELEINVPRGEVDTCATQALEQLGTLGYLKDDSSIQHGFELVTHPMSYRWAIDSFPWQLLDDLAQRGCHGDDTGLHVHVSRDAFDDPRHVFLWMKFIYRNEYHVQALARRVSNQYAAFTPTARANVTHTCKGTHHNERMSAINTLNRTTFELRMFASSLNPKQVQAALAFAAASVEYTRELTLAAISRHRGWEWDAFTRWLDQRPQFAPLTQECEALACAC